MRINIVLTLYRIVYISIYLCSFKIRIMKDEIILKLIGGGVDDLKLGMNYLGERSVYEVEYFFSKYGHYKKYDYEWFFSPHILRTKTVISSPYFILWREEYNLWAGGNEIYMLNKKVEKHFGHNNWLTI